MCAIALLHPERKACTRAGPSTAPANWCSPGEGDVLSPTPPSPVRARSIQPDWARTAAAPVFDREALSRCLEFDESALAFVVDAFVNDAPITMEAIRDGLQHNDFARVGFCAHRMRGAMATLFARPGMKAAEKLEESAADEDTDRAVEAYLVLRARLLQLLLVLEGDPDAGAHTTAPLRTHPGT